MIAGEVTPPGIFLKAAEVLRRQLAAFCLDDWVTTLTSATALPDKTSPALDAVERADKTRFPYTFTDHVLTNEPRLSQAFLDLLGTDIDDRVRERLTQFLQGTGEEDGLRVRLLKVARRADGGAQAAPQAGRTDQGADRGGGAAAAGRSHARTRSTNFGASGTTCWSSSRRSTSAICSTR